MDLYAPRGRFALVLCGSLAFVGLGIYLLQTDGARIAAYFAIAFFGMASCYAISRMLTKRPILTIDAEGLHDRGSALAFGRVAWEDVEHVEVQTHGRQRFVSIHLKDPEALLAKLPPLRRKIVQMQQNMGLASINIPASVLPMPAEDLAALLAERTGPRPST